MSVCEWRHYGRELLELLLATDKLLATDEHFLLGVWLDGAKNLSTNKQEQRLYEYNARNQITLWGPDGNVCTVIVTYLLVSTRRYCDCLLVGSLIDFFCLFITHVLICGKVKVLFSWNLAFWWFMTNCDFDLKLEIKIRITD